MKSYRQEWIECFKCGLISFRTKKKNNKILKVYENYISITGKQSFVHLKTNIILE